MALWGNRDSYAITGTVDVENASATVAGDANTTFTLEVDAADSLYIDGTHVKVLSVDSANTITLAEPYSGSTDTGLTIIGQDSPKYVPASQMPEIYGVSQAEALLESNRDIGLDTPGWVRYVTYTDGNGNVRHKSEVLVAFSSMTSDAPDDAVVADA
jgi:hypothetical protein